jgi:hypothetical protein
MKQIHAAARHRHQAAERAQQGRFAGARLTHNAKALTGLDLQVYTVDRHKRAETHLHILQADTDA